ncbi:uncharacterized protein LOC124496325 [Dermatophagoides farinae]|uniref:Uncharacterized protein n=1 Tax=Dermatophagoides farinae TaxID=6954 RepID=A0A922I6V9_DERFA|nr:uncharacterized protein LOC124496325 [Dermatophagoides farinae]KAH7640580.1 hypothetical protein HUG17_8049 [Dermatophagoides farinae]KAH9526081.1 hypothetical protein DERF_000198 [Dermatophagoides farinae]
MKRIIIMMTIVVVLCMALLINGNPTDAESSMEQAKKAVSDAADKVKEAAGDVAESVQDAVNKTVEGVGDMANKVAEGMPKMNTFNKSSSLQANTMIAMITSVFLMICLNHF